MGRPPLTEEQVRAKVNAYCERHGVSSGREGLPPFPTGKRETRQHREWLTVYRAHQRLKARTASRSPAADGPDAICPLCALPVNSEDATTLARVSRPGSSWQVHRACADLVRMAENAGPDTIARLSALLWPRRRRAGS